MWTSIGCIAVEKTKRILTEGIVPPEKNVCQNRSNVVSIVSTSRQHPPATHLCHPPISLFKVIRRILVAKDMYKHFTLWFEPCCALCEKRRVPLHVFEHLNGEDVGEPD